MNTKGIRKYHKVIIVVRLYPFSGPMREDYQRTIKAIIDELEDMDDLREIGQILQDRAKRINYMKVRTLKVGSKAAYEYNGNTYEGTIRKVNRKTVEIFVDTKNGSPDKPRIVKVSASMIL